MNKIGTLDIIKAYLGNKELSANNAYIGEIPLIKGSKPEPLDKDYFYLQPLSTGNYSISTSDEVWKQNNTFEFRLDKTNWRKFSSLANQETSVGFDVYMANNLDLVALALDINAYNTYIVGKKYRVGISQYGIPTVATFLGTDENFAYYVGTPEEPKKMRFQWGLMPATSDFLNYESNYSKDRMFEWNGTDYSGTNTNISDYSSFSVVTTIITETIPLTANDKLYIRGTEIGNITSRFVFINSIQNNVNYNIGGNIYTIFDYTDETIAKTMRFMFSGGTHLINVEKLIISNLTLSTSQSDSTCREMFSNCTSLSEAPALPATSLSDYCYNNMFYGCTSLKNAPALPATSLANDCYMGMFSDCTSLSKAPELPATSLANDCYQQMFYGCTSLIEAPALPATSLAVHCYDGMFASCSNLTSAPALPATSLANDCYMGMFQNCTSLTEAPILPATSLAVNCYIRMFQGCTSLTTAPALPATSLVSNCYSYMFQRCSKLNKVISYNRTASSTSYMKDWLNGVSATGDFYNLGGATYTTGTSGIPSGWTVHTSL